MHHASFKTNLTEFFKLNLYKNKVMIQINYKDRSFIVEEMTEEDKEILQAEKPELYSKFEKHFKEEKIKVKNKPIKI